LFLALFKLLSSF